MTPDDLRTVQRSWAQLRRRRTALRAALTDRFEATGASPAEAAFRAHWLLSAVRELVDLLSAPSCLAARARDLGETWPDPLTAPSFAIDGRAWLAAADECLPTWSEATADAWRQAWLLLSDVLAAEALSPFADRPPPPPLSPDGPPPDDRRSSSEGRTAEGRAVSLTASTDHHERRTLL